MIFYFSATGNSKYIAEKIGKELNEEVCSILEYDDKCIEDSIVGIITPTYFWGLPIIVSEFLDRLVLKDNQYIFLITTYGTTTGQIGKFVEEKIKLNAKYSVKMPDSWTPMFDLTDKQRISQINKKAEIQMNEIINNIKKRKEGDFMKNKIPMILSKIYYKTYEIQRKTKYFTLEDSCNGCGICVKQCPIKAIEIRKGKAVWIKDKCVMCLGCLHHCPRFSIQYGKNTKKHGQYLNPNIKI